MNVSLTPELEQWVQDKVKTGRYHSASEVIREGLRLLEEQDLLRQAKIERLREDIRRGLESGEPTPLDIEDIIRRGKERFDAQEKLDRHDA
jgi:antitoxin ParD1/3/4